MRFPHAHVARPLRWLALTPMLVLVAAAPMAALGAGQDAGNARLAPAIEAPLGSPVLTVALKSLGAFEGECFPWVRSVVQRATGRTMGYGYRSGYLDAGAIEVSLEGARGGDIIQLVSDTDDGPNADYAGMHTSIVLNAESPGVFRVIDSNLAFDGVVRVREGYNPLALAARFPSINVHVYRFYDDPSAPGAAGGMGERSVGPSSAPAAALASIAPSQPTPSFALGSGIALQPTAAAPGPAQAATTAVIRADGDCLRLRAAPASDAPVLTCLADGGTVSLLSGSQQADGVLWQAVTAGGQAGWVASQYLVRSSAPASAPPVPTPSPAAVASTPAPVAAAPAPAPAIPAANVEGSPAVIGDLPAGGGLALVVFSGGPVNGLLSVVSQRGCNAVSIWASRTGGGLVGMIPGAPSLVNREWRGEFAADSLAARTPLIVVCGGGALPATVAAVPGSGAAAAGPPTARGGTTPPGPAGNE